MDQQRCNGVQGSHHIDYRAPAMPGYCRGWSCHPAVMMTCCLHLLQSVVTAWQMLLVLQLEVLAATLWEGVPRRVGTMFYLSTVALSVR